MKFSGQENGEPYGWEQRKNDLGTDIAKLEGAYSAIETDYAEKIKNLQEKDPQHPILFSLKQLGQEITQVKADLLQEGNDVPISDGSKLAAADRVIENLHHSISVCRTEIEALAL